MITETDKINYIQSLDLHILSHGGVSSNYIADYLTNNGIIVQSNIILHQNTCHYPYKLVPDIKTLYIYGDIYNAIISQYNRNLLHVNATKIHEMRDYDHKSLEYFIIKYPDDPIGIKKQLNNLKNTKNTAFLEYPYNIDTLNRAFTELNINIDFKDFIIKARTSTFDTTDLDHYPIILQKIIRAYLP